MENMSRTLFDHHRKTKAHILILSHFVLEIYVEYLGFYIKPILRLYKIRLISFFSLKIKLVFYFLTL